MRQDSARAGDAGPTPPTRSGIQPCTAISQSPPVLTAGLGTLVLPAGDPDLQHAPVDTPVTCFLTIELVRETCNRLVLNVAYYNDGELPGELRLSPNAGIPGQQWPMLPPMRPGDHAMEITNGFQDDAEPVTSTELTVAIEHIVDNKWNGYIDKRTLAYEKDWSNDCAGG